MFHKIISLRWVCLLMTKKIVYKRKDLIFPQCGNSKSDCSKEQSLETSFLYFKKEFVKEINDIRSQHIFSFSVYMFLKLLFFYSIEYFQISRMY